MKKLLTRIRCFIHAEQILAVMRCSEPQHNYKQSLNHSDLCRGANIHTAKAYADMICDCSLETMRRLYQKLIK